MDSKKMAAELPLKKPIGKSHPTKVYHAIEKRNTALPNAYVYQVSIGKTQQTVRCTSLRSEMQRNITNIMLTIVKSTDVK